MAKEKEKFWNNKRKILKMKKKKKIGSNKIEKEKEWNELRFYLWSFSMYHHYPEVKQLYINS